MLAAPSGNVTFLFTDIEASTRLWEEHPSWMSQALASHDELVRQAVLAYSGYVFSTAGDAFAVAFSSTLDALNAAVEAQLLLAGVRVGDEPLRVRMGIHAGEAEERNGNYFGSTLNRAARIMAAGHGGQILVSAVAAQLASSQLPSDVELVSLGVQRLKDLISPDDIFQVRHPELVTDFPPLRSLDAVRHNLPIQLTSFIGREQELAEIHKLVLGARLVTLTGVGGAGKTRLALQTAAEFADDFRDGVWFVELAGVSDPDFVPSAIAQVLKIDPEPGRDLLDTVATRIRTRRLLLILDNCEHLLGATSHAANVLLSTAPDLQVIATSRELLSVGGEVGYGVRSLSTPLWDPTLLASAVLQFDAPRLLVSRCEMARPGFRMTTQTVKPVVEICQRLDGIPLAIELAAARVRVMGIRQIAEHLDERFRFLTGGSRTALPRQQTLQAAIDWSHDLLDEKERQLFAQLSVFSGFTLEAALSVLVQAGRDEMAVVDLLTALVDKSLLVVEESDTGMRYRQLETIRQYARERLADRAESDEWRTRHASYFADLADQIDDALLGNEADTRIMQTAAEADNFRAAMRWAINRPAAVLACQLVGGLAPYWLEVRQFSEGYEWVIETLGLRHLPGPRWVDLALWAAEFAATLGRFDELAQWRQLFEAEWPADARPRSRARLAYFNASEESRTGSDRHAFDTLRAAVELARVDDPPILHTLLQEAAIFGVQCGNPEAEDLAREQLHLAEATGQHCHLHMAHGLLGYVALQLGNISLGEEQYRLSRRESELAGSDWAMAMDDNQLARVALAKGDISEARKLSEGALKVLLELGMVGNTEITVARLVEIEIAADDPAAAIVWARHFSPEGRMFLVARVLALLAERMGRLEESTQLLSFLREMTGKGAWWMGVDPEAKADALERRLRSGLRNRFDDVWERGAQLTNAEVWRLVAEVIG